LLHGLFRIEEKKMIKATLIQGTILLVTIMLVMMVGNLIQISLWAWLFYYCNEFKDYANEDDHRHPGIHYRPGKAETSIGTLEYFDGVPTPATVQTVYDYLDTSRAVNVFINSIPMLSMYTLREGQAGIGADASHKICIWDDLMDSTTLLLTGNTSTMYAVGFLDLRRTARRSSICRPGCSAFSTTWPSTT
jgi:hypothetical protein